MNSYIYTYSYILCNVQYLSAIIMAATMEERANLQTNVNVLQDGLEMIVHKVLWLTTHSYIAIRKCSYI